VAGNVKMIVDAEGDIFANTLTLAGGQTVGQSTISTLYVENHSYLGDATNADWIHGQGTMWLQANKNDSTASSSALVITQQGTGNYLEVSDGASYYNQGTRYFTIDNSGVASTTKLYVQGSATTTQYLAVGTPTFGSTGVGDVNISGAYRSNGTDYAEYFLTEDNDLEPGEAVSVDVMNPNAVKRANRAADPNIIGIVSTKPGIIGGSYSEQKVVVGLLGQVPAKASAENGAIRLGDSLTSSSEPGVLMKANAGDSTVGVALEGLETDNGMIQVLISRRNKSLTVEEVEEKVQERIAGMEIEDEVNLTVSEKRQVEADIRDIAGVEDEEKPVFLDFESIKIVKPGKYLLDISKLFETDKPRVYQLEDGKYVIDLLMKTE